MPDMHDPSVPTPPLDQVRQLLEENLNYTKACYAELERWRKWMRWQQVWGGVKFVVIVVPLIVGAIYLPPLIQNLVEQYTKVLAPPR